MRPGFRGDKRNEFFCSRVYCVKDPMMCTNLLIYNDGLQASGRRLGCNEIMKEMREMVNQQLEQQKDGEEGGGAKKTKHLTPRNPNVFFSVTECSRFYPLSPHF